MAFTSRAHPILSAESGVWDRDQVIAAILDRARRGEGNRAHHAGIGDATSTFPMRRSQVFRLGGPSGNDRGVNSADLVQRVDYDFHLCF